MSQNHWMRASALARAGALGALIAGAAAPVAFAQDAGDAAGANRIPERIVVTARKREEAVADVPASVAAIGAEAMDNLQLDDVADVVGQIAGGVLVASGPSYLDDIALRGQGSGRLGFSESTTGIYRDGVYVAGGGFGGRSFGRIDFFDAQAVEVYRGPQGALYGRNAVGGAVNVITRRPQDETSARAKFKYGTNERAEIEGVFNTALGENAAVRVGGYSMTQNDGFYTSAETGEALDTEEEWGVRGGLSADLSPNTSIYLLAEHSYSEAPGFTTLGQNLTLDDDPFVRVGLSDQDRVIIEQTSVFGELTHSFSGADLTVLANYKQRDGDRPDGDFDHFLGFNSPALRLLDEQAEEFDRHGFEARLASNGDGPFTWLIGADYQAYESVVASERTGTITGPFAASAALRRQLRSDYSTEDLRSYSVFGLVGYDVGPRTNVTFEMRVQKDEKDFDFERIDGDPLTDDAIAFTTFDESWTRVLPTIAVNQKFSDAASVYLRFATGYRPGGYNPQPAPGFFDETPYDPEDIYSLEAGYKGDFELGVWRLRPQLSVYYTETKDAQQTTSLSPTVNQFALQNVGDNNLYGAEFELMAAAPFAGGDLLANLGLSTVHGEFEEGSNIIFQGVPVDLGGLRVPRTRDYTVAFSTFYTHPLSDGLDGLVSFNFKAEGGGYDNASHTRATESYEIIDLLAGVQTDRWKVSVFGKNLTDDIYRLVEVNGNTFYNTPRSYGVQLSVDW